MSVTYSARLANSTLLLWFKTSDAGLSRGGRALEHVFGQLMCRFSGVWPPVASKVHNPELFPTHSNWRGPER